MENRVVAWLAVFGFALVVAAVSVGCGGDGGDNDGSADGATADDTPGDDGPGGDDGAACGDGRCGEGEDCYTGHNRCAEDCACGSGETCTGGMWEDAASCRPTNPLIEKMPGTWMQVLPNTGEMVQVTVDPSDPGCMLEGQPRGTPGDACVGGFSPLGAIILTDNQLQYRANGGTEQADGQVLEDGRRVEFDYFNGGPAGHFVYTKQ
ncbi:hypothetical protein HY480_03480 [Candidatus Uhrbacteria bacterium]|nr:hypothetical protein [Candidatus Uhrbacteria bacterium]